MLIQREESREVRRMSNLYMGSPITHESERAVLERILHLLERDQRPAVILANVSLNARQIDLIVGTKEMALAIEAKGVTRPIRGGENGRWQVQVASGDWKDFQSSQNPYVQARDAALGLRDAMRSFGVGNIGYPAAALVFVPGIPNGSQPYTGDFKVSVIGLGELDAALQKQQRDAWPLDRWTEFAKHHRLTYVSTVAAACDPTLFEDEDLLRQYVTEFRRANTFPAPLVPFMCRSDGGAITSEEVARLVAEERADILVRGPSGCGKTLLAAQAGLAFTDCGGIVITVPARDYSGRFKAVLDREVGLLTASNAAKVLSAARMLNRPVLFVIDGYNECAVSERASLTRGLTALARKYEGSILVTSQIPLARDDLLTLREIEVPPAEMETKIGIVRIVIGCDAVPSKLKDLLRAVATGLEARLIGEVGRHLNVSSSRHALFDAYARKRLGDSASECIGLLSQIAGSLSDRVAFSMSVRDLDRVMDELGVPYVVAKRLYRVGLLVQRGDRVHFAHELFFDAFAAEQVIRSAAGQAAPVMRALALPMNAERKALILGGIDDGLLLEQVLDRLVDSVSVAACLSGACGLKAKEWTEARCTALWERLRSEACAARFCVSNQGWGNVAFDEATLTTWTPSEQAFLHAMSQRIVEGHCLDDALDIVGLLDQRITDEEARLREESRRT